MENKQEKRKEWNLLIKDPQKKMLSIRNTLFNLCISDFDVYKNGEKITVALLSDKTERSSAEKSILFWENGQDLVFLIDEPFNDEDIFKAEIETEALGRITLSTLGAETKSDLTPSSRRSFLDFINRNYDLDLAVDLQDVIGRRENQLTGFAFSPFSANDGWFDPTSGEIASGAYSKLELLHPDVLRFGGWNGEDIPLTEQLAFQGFLNLCAKMDAVPHLATDVSQENDDNLKVALERVKTFFSEKDSAGGCRRVWEIDLRRASIASGIEVTQQLLQRVKRAADTIKTIDPDCDLIFPGIAPYGLNLSKSMAWNEAIFLNFGEQMDMLGVRWFYPGVKGWISDDKNVKLDFSRAFPDDFEKMLLRLNLQIRDISPERRIPVAISPWTYLTRPSARFADFYSADYAKQDCFYFGRMANLIQRNAATVALAETGWLSGLSGLIRRGKGNQFWGTTPYYLFQMLKNRQNVFVKMKSVRDKEIPSFEWSGIPGLSEPKKIAYVDAAASRSSDGKRLFLFVMNQHPFKRVMARISFMNGIKMRPLEARILRGKDRMDINTAELPEQVFCKDISMRRYKQMDHVNLDIPPLGMATMLLGCD